MKDLEQELLEIQQEEFTERSISANFAALLTKDYSYEDEQAKRLNVLLPELLHISG